MRVLPHWTFHISYDITPHSYGTPRPHAFFSVCIHLPPLIARGTPPYSLLVKQRCYEKAIRTLSKEAGGSIPGYSIKANSKHPAEVCMHGITGTTAAVHIGMVR